MELESAAKFLPSSTQTPGRDPLVLQWPPASLLEELLETGLLLPWLQARLEQRLALEQGQAAGRDDGQECAPVLEELRTETMAPTNQTWQSWCEQRGITDECLNGLAAQRFRLNGLKHQWFGQRAYQLFLEQGSLLDQVRFSVLQTTDADLAQEWYFSLKDGEYEYAELALNSLGAEQHSGGSVGPLRVRDLQAPLDLLLRRVAPGVVQPPLLTPSGRYWVVRLDQRLPARWSESLADELVDALYRQWLGATLQGWLHQQPLPGAEIQLEWPGG